MNDLWAFKEKTPDLSGADFSFGVVEVENRRREEEKRKRCTKSSSEGVGPTKEVCRR
jgi:hypothetical protein